MVCFGGSRDLVWWGVVLSWVEVYATVERRLGRLSVARVLGDLEMTPPWIESGKDFANRLIFRCYEDFNRKDCQSVVGFMASDTRSENLTPYSFLPQVCSLVRAFREFNTEGQGAKFGSRE